MRARPILVLGAAAMFAAGCITFEGAPTGPPSQTEPLSSTEPSLVPVATPQPTAIITLEPGATPSFDIGALLQASITIFNLSDFDLTVTAVLHDPSEDGVDFPVGEFVLGPGQSTTRSVISSEDEAAPYLLDFGYPQGSAAVGGSCTLSVLTGDDFTFVAVNEGLTVNRSGDTSTIEDELFIDSSSLCRPLTEAAP